MRRIFLASALVFWTMTVAAQQIALGERVPELRVASWLNGRMPVQGRPTLFVFFHTSSRPSVESLARLEALDRTFGERVNVVLIVREDAETIAETVGPLTGGGLTVAFDDNGRSFASYGVQYVPYGVLVSPKGRALWQGNPRRLTDGILESNL